ncbi:MAG: hypothetical protein PWR04_1025 [Anaerophaga sp.]|nr:hypothetical protein [Anaerophaga sp.]
MKIIEIGTGYTTIPAKIGAATEIVIENLLISFCKLHIRSELFDISYNGRNTLNENELGDDVIVHRINIPIFLQTVKDRSIIHLFRRVWYSVKLAFFLKRYLSDETETENEIYLHFHNQFNFLFSYVILRTFHRHKEVKTLYTLHTPDWSIVKKIPIRLILEKFALKKADVIICLTSLIKHNIMNLLKIKSGKINVVSNGVNTRQYRPLEKVFKKNWIVNIGSICERKNQLETIKLLSPFLKKYNFRFVFAGKIVDYDYFRNIQSFVEKNELSSFVRYIGEVTPGEALNNLYNSARFYVSHSKSEAFSLVVLESMAAKLPVILSPAFKVSFADSSDFVEEIIKFPEDSLLTSVLEELLDESNYQEYSEEQYRFVLNSFSWDVKAEEIIKKIV